MAHNNRIGAEWERAVAKFLRRWFPNATRRADPMYSPDKGDIAGVPGWVIECKDHGAITLSEYMDQAEKAAARAGVNRFVAVVKRRRKGIEKAYAVLPLEQWAEVAFYEWLAMDDHAA